MNEFLSRHPFDLYQLALFRLVARHGSFTAAGQLSGLTQSAVTRQIQGMERSLGVPLLKRTTRSIALTPAGEYLFRESGRLIGDVENSLRSFRQEFAGAPKELRVVVSQTIGLAYLPGFLHANVRNLTGVSFRVRFSHSPDILLALESDEEDVGVICPPARLPQTLRVAHRFRDVFVLIAPDALAAEFLALRDRDHPQWLGQQNWLLIDSATTTGVQLRAWLRRHHLSLEERFALDNFDLIINLVALGIGISLVPARALALYGQKRSIRRLPLPESFSRDLVVLTRKRKEIAPHLAQFIENILF